MNIEERARDIFDSDEILWLGPDRARLEQRVRQALRDQIEDCAKIVDRVAEVQTKLGHLEEASILRTLATTIRAQAAPKEEEKPDDNQPAVRFDLEGFECNKKQED